MVAVSAGLALVVACGGSEFGSEAAPDAGGSGASGGSGSGGGGIGGSGGAGGSEATGGMSTGGSGAGAQPGSGGGGGTGGGGGSNGSQGSGGSDGTAGGSADASGDVDVPDAGDAGADHTMPDGSTPDACTVRTFYLDGDGDGYGGTTTVLACEPPATGRWLESGGDCDDSNEDVHPGQTSSFAEGYTPTGSDDVSFDYNCSGNETEAGNSPKAACRLQALNCIGGGYLPADPFRSGPGVNPYCGSARLVACVKSGLNCVQGAPYAGTRIACR